MPTSVARSLTALLPGWRAGWLWTGCMGVYSGIELLRSGTTSLWEGFEHGGVWLMGLGVIGLMRTQAARESAARETLAAQLLAIDQRWRAAVESTGDGLWDWAGETNTCFYSPTWKAMIGYADDEFPNTEEAWVAHIHPEDRARVQASVADNMAGRTEFLACEYRLRCKDGSYRWVLGRGRVIARAADGRPLRAVGTHTDITERRTAAEQARHAHERHRFFLEHAADPLVAYRFGAGGKPSPFIEVNAAACRLSGYTREELLRKSPHDLERASSVAERAQRLQDFRTQGRVRFETEMVAADGRVVPVEFHAEWREFAGQPLVLATVRDIRERREAEERRRRDTIQANLLLGLHTRAAEMGEQDLLDHVLAAAREVTGSSGSFVRRAADGGPAEGRCLTVPLRSAEPDAGVLGVTGKATDYTAEDRARVQVIAAELQKITAQRRAEQALRAEQRRFQALFDHAPLGMLEEDFSGVRARLDELRAAGVTDWREYLQAHPAEVRALAERVRVRAVNRRSAELFGVRQTDELHRRLAEHLTEASWPVMRDEFAALAEGQTRFRAEMPARDAQGAAKIFELTLVVEPGHEAKLDRVIVSLVDISERRRAEAEVRKLARAVEQSPVAVVITDTAGVIEYANPQFCRVTGYALEEVRGQNPRVLKSGVLDDAIYRELWGALRAGREWRGELCNRRKDGTLFWEEVSISPIVDEAGRTTHFLGVKEDITARREALARIREQAALIDATRDAFIVVDLAGRVRFWNRGAQEIYGWTAAETQGRTWLELTHAGTQRAADEAWRAILGTGEWRGELVQGTKTGGQVTARVHGLVLRDLAGAPGSVLVTASDITEAKQLEAKFLRAQRLESVGALASGVAHDLNNVLSPIMMSVELLRPLAVTEPDREVLRLMSDSARRGADVVRQLLLFGRGADAPSETMELGKVVKEILRMVRETFPRNITITSQCPRDLWPICGHATELYQVLLNLCVNARDALPQGGRLAIDALNRHVDEAFARQNPGAQPGRYVVLKVTDTGAGIPPEILDRIFDPFFTTKAQGQGTGLGLATVLGIAKSHRGFVTVASRVGEGTEFRVYLPATASDGGGAGPAPAERAWRGRGELVLVVDDEPAIRQVLGRSLAENGYRVLTAATGAEALPLCAKHRATLGVVILDMMMPGIDGPQVLTLMREAAPEVPVVACSGQHGYAATLEKLGLAQVAFVPKPIEIPPLMEKVRILIDARIDREGAGAPPGDLPP